MSQEKIVSLTKKQEEAVERLQAVAREITIAMENGLTDSEDQFITKVRQTLWLNMPAVMIDRL